MATCRHSEKYLRTHTTSNWIVLLCAGCGGSLGRFKKDQINSTTANSKIKMRDVLNEIVSTGSKSGSLTIEEIIEIREKVIKKHERENND